MFSCCFALSAFFPLDPMVATRNKTLFVLCPKSTYASAWFSIPSTPFERAETPADLAPTCATPNIYLFFHASKPQPLPFFIPTPLPSFVSLAPAPLRGGQIFATMQQRTNHFSTFARPTEVTYAHLMRASVMAGDFARALEVWRQQLSAGVAPGSRSTRAALGACAGGGDVDTALEVGLLVPLRNIKVHAYWCCCCL